MNKEGSLAAMQFFEKKPELFAVFAAFDEKVTEAFEGVQVRVQKTQITYSERYNFAAVSLPQRKIPGFSGEFLLVTLGLPCELKSSRIAVATEPYPRRWTHHIPVYSPEDVDEELMCWVKEAHDFSMAKGRK